MIRFRPFRNTDPPALARLWQAQPPCRAYYPRVTAHLLEQLVFSKTYFDPNGLVVAQQNEQIRGFAHAAFGADATGQALATERGVVAMIMVQPGEDSQTIALELIHYSEKYLEQHGAREIYGGGHGQLSPYYLGLYGGSHLPGIMASDERQTGWYAAAGYQSSKRISVLQRRLADFRPLMNRDQLQLRRRMRLEARTDPLPRSWWEASQMAQHEQFNLRGTTQDGSNDSAAIWYWNMEPLASSWGVHAAGLTHWETSDGTPDTPLELFLFSETLRHLQTAGVTLAEMQMEAEQAARSAVVRELGFQEVDRGVVFRRP